MKMRTSVVLASETVPAVGSKRVCDCAVTHRVPRSSQLSDEQAAGNLFVTVASLLAADSFFACWMAEVSSMRYKFRPRHPAMIGRDCCAVVTAIAVNGWFASPAGRGRSSGAVESGRRAAKAGPAAPRTWEYITWLAVPRRT